MPTVHSGVNQTKIANNQMIGSGVFDYTRVKYRDDSKSLTSAPAGDTVKFFGELPAKAKIKNIKLIFEAMGSVTIAVGDSANSARYIPATDVSAVGMVELKVASGFDYTVGTVSGDNQILLTIAGGTTANSAKTVIGIIEYV